MSSIQKRDDKWRVFVLVDGKRYSKTFKLKKEAVEWANEQEVDGVLERSTFRQLIARYLPIAKTHKGWESEVSKINKITERATFIDLPLEYITRQMIAAYRDARLLEVAPATVAREMVVMSSMFKLAVGEFELIRKNPMDGVQKPQEPEARHRGISVAEIETINKALLDRPQGKVVSQMFNLSLETGMRLSEMCNLTWDRVRDKFVILDVTKNGSKREVPLSSPARAIIAERKDLHETQVFGIVSEHATDIFIKAKKRTPYVDVRFHDARSEAVTRLSKKLNVLQLAKMIGHKDIKSLMFYYAESSDDLADKL